MQKGLSVNGAAAEFTAAFFIRSCCCSAIGAGNSHFGGRGCRNIFTHCLANIKQNCFDFFAHILVMAIFGAIFRVGLSCVKSNSAKRRSGIIAVRYFNGGRIKTELDFVKIWVINIDDYIKVIGILISWRIIADFVAFGVRSFNFGTAFVNFGTAARYIRKIKNVGIRFNKVSRRGYHEFFCVFIQKDFCVCSKRPGCMERFYLFKVCFTIGKLLFDFIHGGVPSVAEPRRKFFGAVFAEVAVLKLSVAEKPDFSSADGANFFSKRFPKSPMLNQSSCICAVFIQRCFLLFRMQIPL